jgi:hypothetical protein
MSYMAGSADATSSDGTCANEASPERTTVTAGGRDLHFLGRLPRQPVVADGLTASSAPAFLVPGSGFSRELPLIASDGIARQRVLLRLSTARPDR